MATAGDDLSESSELSSSGDLAVDDSHMLPVISPVTQEPTFPTAVSDKMDLHIHDGDLELKPLHKRAESGLTRNDFLKFLASPNSSSQKNRPKTISRKSTAVRRTEGERMTSNQVIETANTLLKGKKVKVSDPVTVANIVKELDNRRLEALNENEYLKSKKIGDVIDEFKKQFYILDREAMFKDSKEQLEERHRESVEALESTIKQWKEKKQEFVEQCQQEIADIQNRHQDEHIDLESKWTDPSTQRKFTKRSAYLLQQKAVEKYMVLAGKLEEAEKIKKINQVNERQEAQVKYQEMADSFEGARAKLIADQEEEIEKLKSDQEFRYRNLLTNEKEAIELCQRRITMTQQNLDEMSDMDRYIAKKFRKNADTVLPVSVLDAADDLPPLSRGKGVVRNEAGQPTILSNNPAPLQLPPLKMRPVKQKKVTVSFGK